MIYLRKTTDPQKIFVPKDGSMESDGLVMNIRNTTDQREYTPDLTNLNSHSLFFELIVEGLGVCPLGEYEYTLANTHGLISSGLLMILEEVNVKEYTKAIQYTQYESE